MSSNGPPATLISRTPPSQSSSVSKLFRNVTVALAEVTETGGEVKLVPPPMVVGFGANIVFGGVSGSVAEVRKMRPSSTETAVQRAGIAGAATPSKFSDATVDAGLP